MTETSCNGARRLASACAFSLRAWPINAPVNECCSQASSEDSVLVEGDDGFWMRNDDGFSPGGMGPCMPAVYKQSQ